MEQTECSKTLVFEVQMPGNNPKVNMTWMFTLLRTEDYFVPKKDLGDSFRRKRLLGRPQSGWEEIVQKDAVFFLHIQNWKLVAQNGIRRRKLGGPRSVRGPKHHRRERSVCF
jgi:hypothetical protein